VIRPARRCANPDCGKEFTPKSANHKYCSAKCRYSARDQPGKQYPPETLRWLKKRTWENMIHYYGSKLRLVKNGADPGEVFTKTQLRSLREQGILVVKPPTRNVLAPTTIQALGGRI